MSSAANPGRAEIWNGISAESFTDSGIGIKIKEETLATSEANNIVSHHYEDQLDTEDKAEALKIPVIEAQPDIDEKNLENARDILGALCRGCKKNLR